MHDDDATTASAFSMSPVFVVVFAQYDNASATRLSSIVSGTRVNEVPVLEILLSIRIYQ